MKRDYQHLGDIEYFHLVAQLRSFSETARRLGLTPSIVTRAVARLETHLGVRLFLRSTRQVRLTDDGIAYLDSTRRAVGLIFDAERILMGKQSVPQGLLRISAPTTYGNYRLVPRIAKFIEQYPEVQLELNFSNRNIDFVEEGFDLTIRMGELPDSNLIARALPLEPVGVYASTDYLRKHGTPKTLDDLAKHRCLPFLLPSSGRLLPWIFRHNNQDIEWWPDKRISVSEDPVALVALAKHGLGLCQMLKFVADQELNAGHLVEVLQNYSGRTRQFSLLYPQNRHLSAAVRAFVMEIAA
jgi:DNA-binding transcriptional LysR family regulator